MDEGLHQGVVLEEDSASTHQAVVMVLGVARPAAETEAAHRPPGQMEPVLP
jgi:hypothetical protein